MDKVNKTRSIAVDSNNKLVFPQISKLIEANPELGGGNLPDNIQVSDDGYILSIDTTGGNQPNILLEGSQTTIDGLSTKIHGVEGVSIESDTDITFNNVINTNGIHERQLYKNQPQGSYEYKGWYLASKIRVPSMTLSDQESLAWNSWDNIDTYEFQVLLGDSQQEYNIINAIDPTTTYDKNSTIANTLAVGDVLTLKNSSNYIDALKITKIEGNRITYKLVRDRLINYSTNLNRLVLLQSYQLNNPVNASIRCNAKPEAGPVVISGGATATNIGGGSNTTRGYLSTTIGGSCNTNSGDFTIVGGEDNIVSGKSSIIFGNENRCNQEINVVLGNQCQANYKNGSLLGYGLVTNHHNQTIIGQFNETMDSTVPYIENSIMLGTGTSDNERYTSIYAKRNQININAENLIWINSNNKVYISGLLTNIGKDNTFDNPGFTVGAGIGLLRSPLDNSNDTTSQVLVGRYNKHVGNGKVSGTPCFVVGNGTKADRHNAIEVYSGKIDINNDVNINGNLTTTAFTTSNFSTNNISISNSDNYEFCKLTNNSLLFKNDLTLSGDDINKDEVLLTRDSLVFTGQENTPMGTFAPGHIRIYDRGYASFEVKSIEFDSDPVGRMQLTISDGERARSEIGSGTIKIEPTSIVITELTGKEGDYGKYIFSELTITPTNISSSNLSVNINGNSTSDDAKSDSIAISNSNGITVSPSTATQIKNKVGNVHIDGTSISINPAGNSDDWGAGQNYPELFECGHQLKMTNTGISLYDEYNNLAATIDAYGITGGKGWTGAFSIAANSIYLKPENIDNYGQTFRINTAGILSNNKYTTIGCNPDGGYEVSTGKLYYANIGKYELNGLLTSKTIYDYTNSNKVITPSDYTETLLDKLTTTVSGMEFDPETETYEYSYSTGNTTNFEKVAVGLDYFYNVIKELNNRIKELESQSSNQDQESVRLKIKGTNEYCTVTAEKDNNGNITLSVENA